VRLLYFQTQQQKNDLRLLLFEHLLRVKHNQKLLLNNLQSGNLFPKLEWNHLLRVKHNHKQVFQFLLSENIDQVPELRFPVQKKLFLMLCCQILE